MSQVEYNFIKKNKDNSIVVFIKIENDWLDKDLDVSIKNNQIEISLEDKKYTTENLNELILNYYKENDLPIIFCNNDGEFLAEMNLPKEIKSKYKMI